MVQHRRRITGGGPRSTIWKPRLCDTCWWRSRGVVRGAVKPAAALKRDEMLTVLKTIRCGLLAMPAAFVVAVCAVFLRTEALAQDAGFTTQSEVTIPRAVGFFDYMLVDAGRRRVVAAHTSSESVVFVNADTTRVVRQLYLGADPHGLVFDQRDAAYLVGTSGAEHGVFVIDRDSLQTRALIRTPGPVDGVTLDRRRDRVYAAADDGNSIWVLSIPERRMIATIATPRDSDRGEYDWQTDRIYQNFTSTNSTLIIDAASYRVVGSISTAPAARPHGLADDPTSHTLFVAGVNGKLVQLDMRSRQRVRSVSIAPHVDQIALDDRRRRLYCASAEGLLTVVDLRADGTYVSKSLSVPRGARTLAVDPATGSVWLSYGNDRGDYLVRLQPVQR